MVSAALFINYIDRGAFPQTTDLIQKDLHLSFHQLAALNWAFFLPYALSQLPVGWLAERYGARHVLSAAVGLWAISTLLFGLTSNIAVLIGLRALLGLGESAAFPCASTVLAESVPEEGLGRANGVMSVGYLVAPAFGLYFGGMLVEGHSWRMPFLVFGTLSLLWLWPWSRTRIVPVAKPATTPVEASPSFGLILRQRALWGAGLGHFAANYTFYFMLTWLPDYLVSERGFPHADMISMLYPAFLLNGVGGFLSGWMIDRWMGRGASASLAYKASLAFGNGGTIICLLCIGLGDRPTALIAIYAAQFLCGVASPGVFAVSQIFAGPRATGRWVGIQNSIGNMSGVVGPIVTDIIVTRTGHFQYAFVVGAGVAALSVISWVFILPRVAAINWSAAGNRSAGPAAATGSA